MSTEAAGDATPVTLTVSVDASGDARHEEPPTLVIQATHGWLSLRLRDIWEYRELLYFLTWRDIKVRYKQTVLGVGWAVLQPILMMLIFTLLRSRVATGSSGTPDGIPYPVFVFAGLTPWTLFSSGITAASVVLVGNSNLVTKVYFPRLVLPLASAGSYLVDLLMTVVVLLVLMAGYGLYPSWRIVALPALIVLAVVATVGIGFWFSALNARYRDVRYVVPFLLQVGLFVSPIAYAAAKVPGAYQWIYNLNPMVAVIEAFRWSLLGVSWDLGWVPLISVAASMVILVSGAYFFRRVERTFAEEL